jgi:hypothetical protein
MARSKPYRPPGPVGHGQGVCQPECAQQERALYAFGASGSDGVGAATIAPVG